MTVIDYVPRSVQKILPSVLVREWGEEIIVAQTDTYLGKVLKYKMGKAGGLQFHVTKDETFFLYEGLGYLDYDDGSGKLVRRSMQAGESIHIPPGAVHRFFAITDCVGFEASTPVYDDRVRMETWYKEPVIGDGPGLPTTR